MPENIGFNTPDCNTIQISCKKHIYASLCSEATFIFAQKETNKTMFQMEIFSASINYVNK